MLKVAHVSLPLPSLQGFFFFVFHVLRNEKVGLLLLSGKCLVHSKHITASLVSRHFTDQWRRGWGKQENSSTKGLMNNYSPDPLCCCFLYNSTLAWTHGCIPVVSIVGERMASQILNSTDEKEILSA